MNKQIEKYAVLYYPSGLSRINVYFPDGSWFSYMDLDAAQALLLVDILRNEKPIFWSTENEALIAGREPVGEGEVASISG